MADEITQPIDNASESTPAQTYKLKVGNNPDGTAMEKELTMEDLHKYAGLGFTATSKFEEAKQLKDTVLAASAALKNPDTFFETAKELGLDIDSIMAKHYQKVIDEANEDPTAKDLRITKAELEKYMKAEKEAKDKLKAHNQNIWNQKLNTKIETTLKDAKVPVTKENRDSIYSLLEVLAEQKDAAGNRKYPTADSILAIPGDYLVKNLREARVTGFKDIFDEDDFDIDSLPEELQKKFIKAFNKKYSGTSSQNNKINRGEKSPSTPSKKDAPRDTNDILREMKQELLEANRKRA